jgi:hypothetical protein
MANFIEYASKAQEELNNERAEVEKKALKVSEDASLNADRSAGLDKRESEIVAKERDLVVRQEQMSAWETKKRREEEVQKMFDDANYKLQQAEDKLKVSLEKDSDSKQALDELAKRELALSKRESEYREEVKKEIMNKFLGVK